MRLRDSSVTAPRVSKAWVAIPSTMSGLASGPRPGSAKPNSTTTSGKSARLDRDGAYGITKPYAILRRAGGLGGARHPVPPGRAPPGARSTISGTLGEALTAEAEIVHRGHTTLAVEVTVLDEHSD